MDGVGIEWGWMGWSGRDGVGRVGWDGWDGMGFGFLYYAVIEYVVQFISFLRIVGIVSQSVNQCN